MRAKRQFFVYPTRPISKKNIWGPMYSSTIFQSQQTFGGKCHAGTRQKKYIFCHFRPWETLGRNGFENNKIDAPYCIAKENLFMPEPEPKRSKMTGSGNPAKI